MAKRKRTMQSALGLGAPAENVRVGGPEGEDEATEAEGEESSESPMRQAARSTFRDVVIGATVIVVAGVAWHGLKKWLDQREAIQKQQDLLNFGPEYVSEKYGPPPAPTPVVIAGVNSIDPLTASDGSSVPPMEPGPTLEPNRLP
jgi:hypothetical protein